MTIQQLLQDQGLTAALIVDDGYDLVPKASDVASNDAWSNFTADTTEDDKVLLEGKYPGYRDAATEQLQHSDEFVSCLWHNRRDFRPELLDALFEGYEQATRTDRTFLAGLEQSLAGLGLRPIRAGRQIPEEGNQAPIIFADLFLGAVQAPADLEASLLRVKRLVEGREAAPPLVVLMSRSGLLADKKAYFRDNAKLLGTMFRVHSKDELIVVGGVEGALLRLVQHRPDAMRLAEFLHSWRVGLEEANERFLKTIRRLDLADYAQIRRLLLNFEGQPIGSYLLDVFDRVLQFEIEAGAETIRKAEALNAIDADRFPPPYISGSPDLQDLVHRTIFQNPARLGVKATEHCAPVSFGDILLRRPPENPAAPGANYQEADEVLAVLTPACDLARSGLKRVLLIGGKLVEFSAGSWTYKSDDEVRTPTVILPGGARAWIRWNLKNIHTHTPAELRAMTGEAGLYSVSLRLRESYALELQQQLLSDLGRVGLVAMMPANFVVSVSAKYVGADGTKKALNHPVLSREGGICFRGRGKDGEDVTRLVLSESAIGELTSAIRALPEADVNQRALPTLRKLKASSTFVEELERGLLVPKSRQTSQISVPVQGQPGTQTNEVVGLIVRNPANDNVDQQQRTTGALILVLLDAGEPDPSAATMIQVQEPNPQADAVQGEVPQRPAGPEGA